MPRYKSCSGQLINKSIKLVQKYYGDSVPDFTKCIPKINKGIIFTNDKGKSYRFEQEGFNVWRSSFDKWLANKAMNSGVEVKDGTSAVSCEETDGFVSVKLKGESIYYERARYVIDCEGATGALKKKLTRKEAQLVYTYQTFNIGKIDLDYQFFHAYLQPDFSEYDAWFNVKDNQLVLGVSVKDIDKAEVYYNRFISYLRENHGLQIEELVKTDKWIMPHIQPGCPIDYGVGSVLFAGEIAGFLNPMGEGISAGLESGHCVAEAIVYGFDNVEDVYKKYKENVSELHEYMKRQWKFVAQMAGSFVDMMVE